MSQNIVVATAYATLGTDAVVHAVNEGWASETRPGKRRKSELENGDL